MTDGAILADPGNLLRAECFPRGVKELSRTLDDDERRDGVPEPWVRSFSFEATRRCGGEFEPIDGVVSSCPK